VPADEIVLVVSTVPVVKNCNLSIFTVCWLVLFTAIVAVVPDSQAIPKGYVNSPVEKK